MDFEFARCLPVPLPLLHHQRVFLLRSCLERETHIPFVVPPSPYQTRIGLQVHFRVERPQGYHERISTIIATGSRETDQGQCHADRPPAMAWPSAHLPSHGQAPPKVPARRQSQALAFTGHLSPSFRNSVKPRQELH